MQQRTEKTVCVFLLTAFLAILAASAPAQSGPAANGHQVIEALAFPRTQAYGVDDGHILLGAEGLEVSAVQWAIWRTDRIATVVTAFGIDSAADRRLLYQEIRGFAPGKVQLSGENRLQLAGNTYFAKRLEMMTLEQLAKEFPQIQLNCLRPGTPDEEYAVVVWEDVAYANGRAFGAGWAIAQELGFLDLFSRPFRFDNVYHTLSDCPCPADWHFFQLRQVDVNVVASHHHLPTGDGFHNEVLSVIGAAGPELHRGLEGMVGFNPEEVTLLDDSVMMDVDGRQLSSTPRLLTAQQIAAEYPQMDVSHLGGGGVYVVDYWSSVAMIASNMRGNSVANISGTVRVNGQQLTISGRSREIGAQPLGTLKLEGELQYLEKVIIPDEILLPIDLIIVHPTGMIIDAANLGILTQEGDTANAVIQVGNPRSDIWGVLREDVVVTSVDPWTVDVTYSGQVRIDGTYSLPAAKLEMNFLATAKGVEGNLILGVERGNGQAPAAIPVSYRIRYNSTPERELPVRFLQSVTLETRDFEQGTFTGTIERQEGTP